jgi:branched-chain amino acid aminotransferase
VYKLTETSWIWRDGEFIRWQDAQIHVLSHSVQFGSSVFEGIRCYSTPRGPAIFRLQDHLQRMLDSAKIYRMDLAFSIDELVAACCELVERNELDSCYLRPMVVRGYGAASMVPFASPIHVYLPCWPWGTYLGEGALENGVDACVASWNRVAPNTIPAMAKIAGNYLGGQLIKMEAMAKGFAEAIALGTDGMLSEGSGQNLFLVRKGTLYTPPIDGTLLPGITRDSLLKLAPDLGIPVTEDRISIEEWEAGCLSGEITETFACGTAAVITAVGRAKGPKGSWTIGDGEPGPVTKRLREELVGIQYGSQPDPHSWIHKLA